MPRIIKDGAITEDNRASIDSGDSSPGQGQICTLQQWQKLTNKQGSAVQLEPGQEPTPLLQDLEDIFANNIRHLSTHPNHFSAVGKTPGCNCLIPTALFTL
jgi:uncharacterized protein (DUF934 family)